jgi:hypothetical protein
MTAKHHAASAMLAALKEAKKAIQPIMTKADRAVFQRVTAAIAAAEAAGISVSATTRSDETENWSGIA